MTKVITNSLRWSVCKQVVCKFGWKIYEWQDQLRIIVEDLLIIRLTADLFVRSISEQISHKFLLKISLWANLIKVLIDQKIVV